MGLELAATQRDAIRRATESKVLVITGGPGMGKTTIVRGILEMFAAKGLRCELCAPTGRAAKRLGETTGREARPFIACSNINPPPAASPAITITRSTSISSSSMRSPWSILC